MRSTIPAVSLELTIEKRTRPSASAAVTFPASTYWLLPEKLIAPWLPAIERPEPTDQTVPSEAVPQPAWSGRWNVSVTIPPGGIGGGEGLGGGVGEGEGLGPGGLGGGGGGG